MKKHKPLSINYSIDKKNADRLSSKVAAMLDDAIPNNILGMMVTMKEQERCLVFYNRYSLNVHKKNDYSIIDLYTKEPKKEEPKKEQKSKKKQKNKKENIFFGQRKLWLWHK